jgi:hypothetical protein
MPRPAITVDVTANTEQTAEVARIIGAHLAVIGEQIATIGEHLVAMAGELDAVGKPQVGGGSSG